jgi:hypothetical protein
MGCTNCGTVILAHVARCHVCGADVGFPNVRAAEAAGEQAALAVRVNNARVTASARGCLAILEDFGRASSRAVLARSLGALDAFVKSDNLLYISFHRQVRAGARIPEDSHWDKGRAAAESTVHPIYSDEINYTALSLDGVGVLWWGEYSIVLKELHIASRTTVFEENPFSILRTASRHRRPTSPSGIPSNVG